MNQIYALCATLLLIIPKFLFSIPADAQWNELGLTKHYGVDVPLYSVYSQDSLGCGEFYDLIPLIQWSKEVGFDILQLLPLNDSDNSPYAINSAFALDFIYLSLSELPGAEQLLEFKQVVKALGDKEITPRLEWDFVRVKKEIFLRAYFDHFYEKISRQENFQQFVEENAWLQGYGLFKTLKRVFGDENSWEKWPDPIRSADPEVIARLCEQFADKIEFFIFVQFLCFEQLKEIKEIAREEGVFLMGNLPALPQKDSADVWLNQKLFFIQDVKVSQPDLFSDLGQQWGFPAFNWHEAEKTGYCWWLDRIEYAVNFYHIYQIDQAMEIFNVLEKKDFKVKLDVENRALVYDRDPFFTSPYQISLDNGQKFLKVLLENFIQLPSLAKIDPQEKEVNQLLYKLGVCNTKIVTDLIENERRMDHNLKAFPLFSLTALSHDAEPIRLFWKNHPVKAKKISEALGWDYDPELQRDEIFNLLKLSFSTKSLLHVNLLQDYLDLVASLSPQNLREERVNIPGTNSQLNWSYRLSVPIETIITNRYLKENIQHLISNRDFVPSPEPPPQQNWDLSKNWYNTFQAEKEIDEDFMDPNLSTVDQVRLDFSKIGSTCSSRGVSWKQISVQDVMMATLRNNPLVAASYYKAEVAQGQYIQSLGPFDPEIFYEGQEIVSIDTQYPPAGIRTHRTGTELINEIGLRKKFETGAQFLARVNIDQNLNRILPIYGPEPISKFNNSTIELRFDQPILKDFCWNRDAVQEKVNYLALSRAYYTYLDEVSLDLVKAIQNYWDWVAATLFTKARELSVARIQKAYEYVLDLVELELLRDEDIAQLQGYLNQRKTAYIFAENTSNTALQKLKVSMGYSTDDPFCFEPPFILDYTQLYDLESSANQLLLSKHCLVRLAKQNRYDILASIVDQDIFNVYLKGARNQLLPRLDVFVDFELFDFTQEKRALGYLSSVYMPKTPQKDISVGLLFSYPICNDRARGMTIEASANLQESVFITESLRQDAERLILENLFKIESLPKAIWTAKEGQDQYYKLLNIEGKKISATAIFTYIEFERRLNDAINDEINAFSELMKSVALLNYGTGQLIDCNERPIDPMCGKFCPCTNSLWSLEPAQLFTFPQDGSTDDE